MLMKPIKGYYARQYQMYPDQTIRIDKRTNFTPQVYLRCIFVAKDQSYAHFRLENSLKQSLLGNGNAQILVLEDNVPRHNKFSQGAVRIDADDGHDQFVFIGQQSLPHHPPYFTLVVYIEQEEDDDEIDVGNESCIIL